MRTADYSLGAAVDLDVRARSCSPARVARAVRRSLAHLHRVDEMLSTWRPDSPINRLRRDEIMLSHAPPEVAEVLWRCADARRTTGGWFDPWADPGGVDPSGLVRGWAVAGGVDLLRRSGVPAALLRVGEVAAAYGAPEPGRRWDVPVPSPGRGTTVTRVAVGGTAVATVPARHGAAGGCGSATATTTATVAGPDPAMAEALARAVLSAGRAAGPPAGLDVVTGVPGYEAMVVDGGDVRATAGFATTAVTCGPGVAVGRGGPAAA